MRQAAKVDLQFSSISTVPITLDVSSMPADCSVQLVAATKAAVCNANSGIQGLTCPIVSAASGACGEPWVNGMGSCLLLPF
jgi:hypothetical protein